MPQSSPFGRNTYGSSKARGFAAHANNLGRRLEIETDPDRVQWIRDECTRLLNLANEEEKRWQATTGEKKRQKAARRKAAVLERQQADAERKRKAAEKKANAKPVGRQTGQTFPGGYMTEKRRRKLEEDEGKKGNGK